MIDIDFIDSDFLMAFNGSFFLFKVHAPIFILSSSFDLLADI